MESLVLVSNLFSRIVTRIGQWTAWLMLALIGVIIFDVVTRRFLVLGSTKLQELEWHIHTVLFLLCLGYAYIKNAHVRIELVRERLSPRTQIWLELLGCIVFMMPYCGLIAYFSIDFVGRSYGSGEISSAMTGLAHRWVIKSILPIGFLLLLISGLSVLLRCVVLLFASEDMQSKLLPVDAGAQLPEQDRPTHQGG